MHTNSWPGLRPGTVAPLFNLILNQIEGAATTTCFRAPFILFLPSSLCFLGYARGRNRRARLQLLSLKPFGTIAPVCRVLLCRERSSPEEHSLRGLRSPIESKSSRSTLLDQPGRSKKDFLVLLRVARFARAARDASCSPN